MQTSRTTMTKLIEKNDPRYFSQTSDKLYDKHNYKIVSSSKTFIVESWQEVQEWWWNNNHQPLFDAVVHVIDKPKTKKKSKGF